MPKTVAVLSQRKWRCFWWDFVRPWCLTVETVGAVSVQRCEWSSGDVTARTIHRPGPETIHRPDCQPPASSPSPTTVATHSVDSGAVCYNPPISELYCDIINHGIIYRRLVKYRGIPFSGIDGQSAILPPGHTQFIWLCAYFCAIDRLIYACVRSKLFPPHS